MDLVVPETGDCHVWWAHPADSGPHLVALLDAGERGRLAALRRAGDRDRFVVACALLRLTVGAYLGLPGVAVTIDRSCHSCARLHGKPRLTTQARRPLELSVTHSGGRVAVAVTLGAPVGIDVEGLHSGLSAEDLGPYVLAPAELPVLAALPAAARLAALLTYWTRKEAVLKAVGVGLRMAPSTFAVSPPDEWPRLLRWPHAGDLPGRLHMHPLRPGTGYVASVAVIGGGRVVERDGSPMLRP